MNFFKFGGSTLGLDVGASAIKIIKGQSSKDVFVVEKMALQPIPPDLMDAQGIKDIEKLSEILVNTLSVFGKDKLKVSSSVRGAGVITKRITIPKIPKKEIPDQVNWEAEQVFSQDIENILVDHVVLGEGTRVPGAPAGTKGWDLLLVGVRKDSVAQLKLVIDKSPAQLKFLDVDSFAVGDLIDGLMGFDKNQPVALVDIGATGTKVSIRYHGNIVFIREFSIGGNAFTDMIAQTLGLSFQDAEALKIQDGSGIPKEAHESLETIFVSWKNELQQCEDIFVSQEESDALIDRWYFFGGGVLTPGLLESLKSERIADKVVRLPTEKLFKAKNNEVDANVLRQWSTRLLTSASLCGRT